MQPHYVPKEDLELITKKDMQVYITPSLTELPEVNLKRWCNSFISLKNFYDGNKQNMPFIIKENNQHLVSKNKN